MSEVRLCPACGIRRMGAFRYCLSCRLDFDALGPDAHVPSSPTEPSWPDPDEARQAILRPRLGAPPPAETVESRQRRLRGRRQPGGTRQPGGIRWITNAIASIGIVALIGVAFSSTGFVPIDAPTGASGTVVAPTDAPATADGAGGRGTGAPTDPAATPDPAAGGPVAAPATDPGSRPARPAPRVVHAPVSVTAAGTTIRGAAGTSTWSVLRFSATAASFRWSATSEQTSGCALRWTLADAGGKRTNGQLKVTAKGKNAGQRTLKVKRGVGRLVVETDCANWSLVAAAKRG
jgi:hypothetical protein